MLRRRDGPTLHKIFPLLFFRKKTRGVFRRKSWGDVLPSFAPIIPSGRRSGRSRKLVLRPSSCRCLGFVLSPLQVDDKDMSALLTTGGRNRFGAGFNCRSRTSRAVSFGQLPTPDWTRIALTDEKPFTIQARGAAKGLQDSRENLLVFKGMSPISFSWASLERYLGAGGWIY